MSFSSFVVELSFIMIKMAKLNYDLDENEDVLNAIQTILNAFSSKSKYKPKLDEKIIYICLYSSE